MPDFLVIGAPKAGTTALHAALSGHPGLYMSAIKEPKWLTNTSGVPVRGPGEHPGEIHVDSERTSSL